jgi:AcrR family transcriptional regulator
MQTTSESKTPKTKRGIKTREKLLEAAEVEFGSKGYHDCMIADITRRAGVAMGTFYIYYESKEEIFRELVSHMGRLTRSYIAQKIMGIESRLEAEKQGLKAYIEFARENKNLYRIVMESQFVALDAFKEYYRVFANAYETNLKSSVEKGQIRDGNNEIRAWSLIGLSTYLGMKFGIWDDNIPAQEITDAAFDFIENGLKP